MACGATACRSGCYKEEVEDDKERVGLDNGNPISTTTNTTTSLDATRAETDDYLQRLCFKCKIDEGITLTGVEESSRLCLGCFRNSVFGKFKQAVTSHDMISPTDNVLVAFSGGPASRVALQFVHEMQLKAQRNLDASRDKLYPVFGVGVAFVDENAVSSIPSHEFDNTIKDMGLLVSSLSPPTKELHIMPIQSIFSSNSKDGRSQLKELLHTVADITGKEDLLQHLRMLSLHKVAFENKYNKLILGSCTSRIASHVISATVKGQGYSLPADVQYIDARLEIPVVLPLRDCLLQELTLLCRLDSLKTFDMLDGPRSGINALVSTFTALLQSENPSRERTIVRTAEKLIPFHFNRLTEANDSSEQLLRWRRRKQNLKPDESIPSEFLCPICSSPVNKSDLECLQSKLENCEISSTIFGASCCPSCQFQILPKELSSMEQFYSHLPQQVLTRAKDCIGGDQTWLREQIKDCLLSNGED